MGPEGWKNYGALWPKKRGYKEIMAITEAPNGEVWTAWVPNNRKKLGSKETPSWAFLDGTDSIAVALPEVTASISFPHGKTYKSQLFVVGSPIPISREQKAVLIDARTKIPKSQFSEYLKEMTKVRGREFQ